MKKRKLLSLLVAVAMLATCFATAPALAKSKKVKKGPALVKQVIVKYCGKGKKKWSNSSKEVYTYKNGYPTLIKRMSYNTTSVDMVMRNYKFKGKKPKSMTLKNYLKVTLGSAKYTKGLNTKYTWRTYDKSVYEKATYKWKKGFITRSFENRTNKTTDGIYKSNYTYDYKYKFKKGLPLRCEATYKAITGYKGKEKEKYESSRKFVTEFGKAGIIKRKGDIENGETKIDIEEKNIVKFKKGRVASITTYEKETNETGKSEWKPEMKYLFKYNNVKISKQRYSNMINDIVQDDIYYGRYIWF